MPVTGNRVCAVKSAHRTLTVTDAVSDPEAPVQVRVYVVAEVGFTLVVWELPS
jgi:hypothetical protein